MLGDLRNGLPGCANVSYNLRTLRNDSRPLDVSAATDGSLWVIVGSESGFESPHHLYYPRIRVTFTPLPSGIGY